MVLQLDTSGLVRVQKAEAIFEIEETQEAPKKKPSLMGTRCVPRWPDRRGPGPAKRPWADIV